MALPPKIPTNWPTFPHHRTPSINSLLPTTQPSWVEEFLDFSSAKRGSHRRSASDSVAFFEAPVECSRSFASSQSTLDFDRLDGEHIMSMFSNDRAGALLSVAPNSDDTNNNDNEDNKSGEVEIQLVGNSDTQTTATTTTTTSSGSSMVSLDPSIDPKRVKRILANRQSAQRSRVRKLQYISELERSVTSLQTEVSTLSPRVAFLDHQRLVLNVDNSALKQRIAALAQDKLFKDAHQEALKQEIERLRQVYHQQNLEKITSTPEEP